MKNFDFINRRTHLYLSFFLFPWFLMYGVSSLIIIHPAWFGAEKEPEWTTMFDKSYEFAIPENQDIRVTAQQILAENGFRGAFWANRPNSNRINMNQFSFLNTYRFTYFVNEKRLLAEEQHLDWVRVIQRLHFRGGFIQPYFLDHLWAWIVDLVCLSMVVWIVTGLFMWWRLRKTRMWGMLAIAGGLVSAVLLIWGM